MKCVAIVACSCIHSQVVAFVLYIPILKLQQQKSLCKIHFKIIVISNYSYIANFYKVQISYSYCINLQGRMVLQFSHTS